MLHIFRRPKVLAPLIIIISFIGMVSMQILFEKQLIAKEIKVVSSKKKLMNTQYNVLMKEAQEKGYQLDPKKPLQLVNFWASWCQPCLREFKSMKKALKKYASLQILGVNQDDSSRAMLKTQKKYKLPFFSYLDIKTKMANSFKIKEYPFSIVYCHGQVLGIFEGETNFMSRKIKKLIQKCQ